MSQLQIDPLHEDFGARITGVDLTAKLSAVLIQEIADALDEYSFVCFPDQDMNDDAQLALTMSLGAPEPNHIKFGSTGEIEYIGTVGNVVDDKTKRGNDDPHTQHQKGNNMWHTDSSFRLVPSKFSINHAYEVPGEGGATQYVSTRVAYEDLPAERKSEIDPLLVLHDYVFSRSQVAPVNPNHAASLPPVEHKLVRTNPCNGRKNFYVGSHARSIVGWHGVQGRALIDELADLATRPERIYAHQWQVGDTVIWDNRCILHRGVGYDADKWRRKMRQSRVEGAGPTIDE
ncbi:MAG: TauD/TfdA family dioxygenase [Gammaproteobacteria bacterium]|nr:TauD/TfdA family dioxygenase [Gammaproteobacteria bacterium]